MALEAQNTLWDRRRNLKQHDKSSPPALTDVFVAQARIFLKDDSPEAAEALDEVIGLSIQAGIPRDDLLGCLAGMREVGSISPEEYDDLLGRIPPEASQQLLP